MFDLITLLQRDLITIPRQRGFYVRRMAIIGLPCAIILVALFFGALSSGRIETLGLTILQILAPMLIFCTWIGAAFIAGGLVVSEVEQQTIQVLSLTRIGLWQIFLGKFLSACLNTGILVAASLPLMILIVSLGGAGGNQFLALIALTLCVLVLGCGTGLLVGILSGSRAKMGGHIIFAVLVEMVLGRILVGIGATAHLYESETFYRLRLATSPFLIADRIVNGTLTRAQGYLMLSFLAMGVALALAGLPLLRRLATETASAKRGHDRRKHPLPAIWDDIICWHDLMITYGGARRDLLLVLVLNIGGLFAGLIYYGQSTEPNSAAIGSLAIQSLVVLVAVALVIGYLLRQVSRQHPYTAFGIHSLAMSIGFLAAVAWALLRGHAISGSTTLSLAALTQLVTMQFIAAIGFSVVLVLQLIVRSSQSLSRDNRSQLVESLLLSDVTIRAIVNGKVKAIAYSILPNLLPVVGLVVGAALCVASTVVTQDPEPQLQVFGYIIYVVVLLPSVLALCYGLPRIGIWLQVKLASNTSVMILMLAVLVLPVVSVCGLPFAVGGVALFGGILNEHLPYLVRNQLLRRR